MHLSSSAKKLVSSLEPNRYIPHRPFAAQAWFLLSRMLGYKECLYGGAAGGGKTDAVLMAALWHMHHPGHSAVIFRRTNPQFWVAGGLIPRALEWLAPYLDKGVRWNSVRQTLHFPGGATLRFAQLQYEKTKHEHQGAEYDTVLFDELTHFSADQYRYIFSRVRRKAGRGVAGFVGATCNPGGVGHKWVKERFRPHEGMGVKADRRLFLQAYLEDNPYIDTEEYDAMLQELGHVEYQRLRYGRWDIEHGDMFDRSWLQQIVPAAPPHVRWLSFVDPATKKKEPSDQTAHGYIGVDNSGNVYLDDIVGWRDKWPGSREKIIVRAQDEGYPLFFEAVAGFKNSADDLAADPRLTHMVVRGVKVKGDKRDSAMPLSVRAEKGQVFLVDGPWISAFVDQCVAFPGGGHDDLVDVAAKGLQCHKYLGHRGMVVGRPAKRKGFMV